MNPVAAWLGRPAHVTNYTAFPFRRMFNFRREPVVPAKDALLASLMEAAGELVVRINAHGEILQASERAGEFLSPGIGLQGQSLIVLFVQADRNGIEMAIRRAIVSGRACLTTGRMRTAAATCWMELLVEPYAAGAQLIELLVVGRDITLRLEAEERMRHLATHDALTGLPNRNLLSDRLHMAFANARRTGGNFSVIALSLDGFRKINEALGHPVGDALLRLVADRVLNVLRNIDTLARAGGDEFVAVLPGTTTAQEVQAVARRIAAVMQQPFVVQGHSLYGGTSMGASIYPGHGEAAERLLANAEAAMHQSKKLEKGPCVVFGEQGTTGGHAGYEVSLEAAMFQAVREGEFLLHYQPIVDARSRQIVGFEALMRWYRASGEAIPPVQFIPIAESNGLINMLGAWALKAACVQVRRFSAAAGRPFYISVNVSPRQFRNEQFLKVIDEAIELSGLQGDQLLLEITEGILMSDPEHAEMLLNKIIARNIRIAIDDFGTGYSSLAYLKRFPIATIKIDRAFVRDLPGSEKDVAICNVVLSLARHLQLATVAEGVENEEQLAFLAQQGCGLVQGYYTGRPCIPEAILDLLSSKRKEEEQAT